jgi:dihydropyrimidinase
MNRVLIHGGTLVTSEGSSKSDLLIEGERIAAVGAELGSEARIRVDASGLLVMPGGIDPHTHFNLPMFDTVSSDDHYTGHKAAAFGGTTTVIDFVPQEPGWTLKRSVEAWHEGADDLAAIDFSFHMNVTELTESVLEEIPSLLELGIPTVKVFTAYNGRLRLQDGEIFQVMQLAAEHGMLTMLHAENGDVIEVLVRQALDAGHKAPRWHERTRPAWGAVESVLRAISLAEQAHARLYVVHLNTAGGLDQIRYGKERGARIMTETCPQYLFFTQDHLEGPGASRYICSPPLRSTTDNEALWSGLEDGSIDVFATDHCPFFHDGTRTVEYEGDRVQIPGKELGSGDFTKIPNGVPGVGDRMLILWSYGVEQGRISPERFVALTSTNAAKIFGLYPRKGSLEVGADADIVMWNPQRRLTYGLEWAHHRTDYNLYEGWELKGYPEKVFLRGRPIVEAGEWLGARGEGQFLERGPTKG